MNHTRSPGSFPGAFLMLPDEYPARIRSAVYTGAQRLQEYENGPLPGPFFYTLYLWGRWRPVEPFFRSGVNTLPGRVSPFLGRLERSGYAYGNIYAQGRRNTGNGWKNLANIQKMNKNS